MKLQIRISNPPGYLGGDVTVVVTGRSVDVAAVLADVTSSMHAAPKTGRRSKAAQTLPAGMDAPNITLPPPKCDAMRIDWCRYMSLQHACSDVHVRKSSDAAALWCTWAAEHGWTPSSAMRWSQHLVDISSRKTAQNKVSQAREFCRYCLLVQAATVNPFDAVKLRNGKRERSRQIQPFNISDVSKLIDVAEAREASVDRRRSKNGPLASTMYAFLTLTGLRLREAKLQLWSDIDLAKARMIVTADKARRQDEIPLCIEAVSVLRAWRNWSSGERLFPQVPSAHTLRDEMTAAGIARAGDGQRGEWHRFRKTAISQRAGAGADVRNLHHFARHENLQTTLTTYDRAKVEQLRGVAELMPRLNGFLKREAAGVGISPDKNLSGIRKEDLTNWGCRAEDRGVQAENRRGTIQAPPHHHDRSLRVAPTVEPEQPAVKRRGDCARSDAEVTTQNGAVGSCTPGPNLSSDQIDRVITLLEQLLGVAR